MDLLKLSEEDPAIKEKAHAFSLANTIAQRNPRLKMIAKTRLQALLAFLPFATAHCMSVMLLHYTSSFD